MGKTAQNDPKGRWEDIDPKKAKKYLLTMGKNRRLRKKHAENLALLMSEGHWKQAGDPIRFNRKGQMFDGQHRLQAIIDSGVTCRMYVMREVPNEAFMDFDTGAVRSPGDLLAIAGHRYSNNMAALVRNAHSIQEIAEGKLGPTSFAKRKMAPAVLLKWSRDYQERILEAVRRTTTGDARNICRPPSVFGALYFLFSEHNPSGAQQFFETLCEGVSFEYGKEDPIYILRRTLLGMKDKKHLKRPNYYKVAITIKAWNLFQDRQSTKTPTFRFSEVEGWPEINPRSRRLNEAEAEALRKRREKRAAKVRTYDRKAAAKKAADTKAKRKKGAEGKKTAAPKAKPKKRTKAKSRTKKSASKKRQSRTKRAA